MASRYSGSAWTRLYGSVILCFWLRMLKSYNARLKIGRAAQLLKITAALGTALPNTRLAFGSESRHVMPCDIIHKLVSFAFPRHGGVGA